MSSGVVFLTHHDQLNFYFQGVEVVKLLFNNLVLSQVRQRLYNQPFYVPLWPASVLRVISHPNISNVWFLLWNGAVQCAVMSASVTHCGRTKLLKYRQFSEHMHFTDFLGLETLETEQQTRYLLIPLAHRFPLVYIAKIAAPCHARVLLCHWIYCRKCWSCSIS